MVPKNGFGTDAGRPTVAGELRDRELIEIVIGNAQVRGFGADVGDLEGIDFASTGAGPRDSIAARSPNQDRG